MLRTMYALLTFGRMETLGISSADVETTQEALSLRYCAQAGPPTEPFEAVTVKVYSTPARPGTENSGSRSSMVGAALAPTS